MDKIKKIFSNSSDKETKDAKSYGRKSIDSGARGTTGTSTGLGSSTAGDTSSYEKRGEGFASSAENELTSGTTGSSSATKDINRPFAKDDPVSASGAGTSSYAAGTTEGYTGTSGVSDSAQTAQPTSAEYGSTGTGFTGTALADRSVGDTGSETYDPSSSTYGTESGNAVSGGPHPTFTGNRLDPAAVEEIPTYHEEVAAVHKHHATGAPPLERNPTGLAATYVVSGAEAEQYQGASSISTYQYGSGTGSQSYGTTDTTLGSRQTETVDRSATGPAPNTIGPHSSDLMNVVDPRVQPEPALMKGEQSSRDNYGQSAYESEKPSAVRRYEEDRGTAEGESYARTGATAGAAGVDTTEYPVRDDLEHHEAIEDRDRKQSKGGPLGFLHSSQKDKYDDPAERDTTAREKYFGQHGRASGEQDRSTSGSHVGRDVAGVGAVGGLGAAAASREYDPYSTQGTTTALPATSTTTTTTTGVYDPYAREATTGPTGFAVGQTGSSGTTTSYAQPAVAAAAATTAVPEKKHTFGFLHRKDPNKLHKEPPSRGIDDAGDGRVIDSVTGLPMNVAKYGSGAGGVDGNKAVQGYEAGLNQERLASEGTADYKAIGKANVPY